MREQPFAAIVRGADGFVVGNSRARLSRYLADHEFIRQFWVQADGTGREWLAVEYEYRRRRVRHRSDECSQNRVCHSSE
jgi:hypothetical protein